MSRQPYYKIYSSAHKNAFDLYNEAELLYEHKHYPRAYALAFTALEEISKSQFAADVATRFENESDFKKFYRDHNKKIKRMGWAHLDANSYQYQRRWRGPDHEDIEILSPEEPFFDKRQNAMYVDVNFDDETVVSPGYEISAQDAREIIHVVEIALQRIWETTEYWGHQIGTKGFLK